MMPLYELGNERITAVEETTFPDAGIQERWDLQRLFRDQLAIIVQDAMVLAEEFSNWEESGRSIDLLALDKAANLVVVELKRTEDGGYMDLQAIRYGAMVAGMRFQQAVEFHREYLAKRGIEGDPETNILNFLGWESPQTESFAQDVRIVLVSANFGKELTTAVLWLNDYDIDIRCVRIEPYRYGDKTLLDVRQVVPPPEAADYQVRLREKSEERREGRQAQRGRKDRYLRFWTLLLPKANAALSLHQSISPWGENWLSESSHGLSYQYVLSRGDARVQLYLARPDRAENKAIFDEVSKHRSDIQSAFGRNAKWDWVRNDNDTASRIAVSIEAGSANDESSWEHLHAAMIDGMQRFEGAMRPHVERYRQGESPDAGGPPRTGL